MDQLLLDVLVCPKDKMPLWFVEALNEGKEVFFNDRENLIYEVKDSIPDMIVDHARTATTEEVAAITAAIKAGRAVQTGTGKK